MTMNYELMMQRANRILPAMMAESLPRIFLDSHDVMESDPCVQVDTRDMQTLCAVVAFEPKALGLPINIQRGRGQLTVACGPYRMALPFQKIDTQTFTVAKSTITRLPGADRHHLLLREFSADPLLRIKNGQFLRYVASATGLTTFRNLPKGTDPVKLVHDGGTENTLGVSDSRVFNTSVYETMMRRLMRRQVQLRSFLMHLDTFEAAVSALDLSNVEVAMNGAHRASHHGIMLHTPSIYQMECIKPGHVYGFGDRSCLGKHLTLSKAKLWIGEKKDDEAALEVRAWEMAAMGIILTDACAITVLADAEPLEVEVTQEVSHRGFISVGG